MAMFAIRFDLRLPPFATTTRGEQYRAALDMASWAEQHGFAGVTLSEHHGTDDGYLPAPVVMAAAIGARTERIPITIAAVLVPMHNPLRLAEDIAVADHITGGRLMIVAGMGYRDAEYTMFGIPRNERGARLEAAVNVLRQAWTGEPFEYEGRTVRVTPRPFQDPHPMLLLAGSTEFAARRAARLRLALMPALADPELDRVYYEECAKVGFDGGFVLSVNAPGMVHVTEDPEKAWAQIGPHALFDAQTYASWQRPGQRSSVHDGAATLDELKAHGVYRVVTPDECVAVAEEFGMLMFHPLMGGLDPALGWESLELFASKVAPRLNSAG